MRRGTDDRRRASVGSLRHWMLAILVLGVVACQSVSGGLSADSTCREYLSYSTEERSALVRTLGTDLGWRDAGNPMAVLNVDSHCSQRPDQTMEQALTLFAQ